MKYRGVLFLLIGFPGFLNGQNLVPNPGFENYKHLPCEQGLYSMEALLENWLQPIPTTPEYWNSLAAPDCLLNPTIINESAHTGHAMVGIVTAGFEAGFKSEYKEYVEVELLSKLKPGKFYNVEFFAKNRIQSPNPYPSAIFQANNLGAAFSDSLIHITESVNYPNHLFLRPVAKALEVVKQNWQKIGGCFNARSASQYLLIGNFNSIDSTKVVQLTPDNADYSYAYYLIDDVVVEELPYDVSSLIANPAFCPDQTSVELNAFVDGATSYAWDDGSSGASRTIIDKISGEYTVHISFNECVYEHTYNVTYFPPISIGSDTTLCKGEVLELSPGYPVEEFNWSDGSEDSVRYVSEPGSYAVAVASESCTLEDSVSVDFVNCPGFIPNIITPNDDTLNDYFILEDIKNRSWSLTIINRWGEQVYFNADYKNDWNGNGLPEGIYFYKLSSVGMKSEVKGWVSVFR